MQTDKAVLFARSGHIGIITLNRPDNRNSMTPELLDAFQGAVADARKVHELRVVVLTGLGSCFSSGADFNVGVQRGGGEALASAKSYAMYEAFLGMLDLEVPVIGALNGHAVGGGFGLSLLCDMRIANRDAKYGANFTRLGFASGMAISHTLPRIVGLARASELLYTGELINGERAAQIGYANEAVAADEVMPRAMHLAERIARSAPLAVRATRAGMRRGMVAEIREAARLEAFAQAETVATEDAREGMAALLEKRVPTFHGR
jgi:enoyl-CoA hydratase/carnithine racemase